MSASHQISPLSASRRSACEIRSRRLLEVVFSALFVLGVVLALLDVVA